MKRKYDITNRNHSGNDVKKIALELRGVFLRSSVLPLAQQKMLIGIYLRYLIYSRDIVVHTESELQVLIYKFAKEVFDEYDTRTIICVQAQKTQSGVNESVGTISKTTQNNSAKYLYKNVNSNYYTQSKIVQHILTPYENIAVSSDDQNRVREKLQHRLHDYLSTSEAVLEKVVDKVAQRLIAAMEPKSSLGSRIMYRIHNLFLFSCINPIEKKFLRVKRYHEKGLLSRDCKQMYRREIMKYVSE